MREKRVLVTGFDPFGGEKINPSYEAVKRLPERIAGAEIIRMEIPTVFSKSTEMIEQAIDRYQPDLVISVGQAGGRSCVTIERVAINLAEAHIPDNEGEKPDGVPIQKAGAPAYYATIPVKAMVQNVRNHGIPCHISYSSGTFVCNSVMYQVLHLAEIRYPHMRAGFIHVPFSAGQAVEKPAGTPFMSLDMIVESLKYAIEAAVTVPEDIQA